MHAQLIHFFAADVKDHRHLDDTISISCSVVIVSNCNSGFLEFVYPSEAA